MKTRQKPELGQKLFRLNIGYKALRVPQVLTPVVVTKVGRKYFTVARLEGYPIESEHLIETWGEHTEYAACNALYESEQEYKDECEEREILNELSTYFRYGNNDKNLPLSILRDMWGMIHKDDKPLP